MSRLKLNICISNVTESARLLLLSVIICLFCFSNGYARSKSSPSYFKSTEIVSENLKPFTKWDRIVKNLTANSSIADLKEWKDNIKGKNNFEVLSIVNKLVNENRYVLDHINWGIEDYWATPHEFDIKNGDCEDFAIAKYHVLSSLGVPKDKMRIVILNDENLRILHAVLIVKDKDTNYMLDNQISQVVDTRNIHHYTPIYSINEYSWWLHRTN